MERGGIDVQIQEGLKGKGRGERSEKLDLKQQCSSF